MEEHALLLDRYQALVEPGPLRRLGLAQLPSPDQILAPVCKVLEVKYEKNKVLCNLIVIWKLLWII